MKKNWSKNYFKIYKFNEKKEHFLSVVNDGIARFVIEIIHSLENVNIKKIWCNKKSLNSHMFIFPLFALFLNKCKIFINLCRVTVEALSWWVRVLAGEEKIKLKFIPSVCVCVMWWCPGEVRIGLQTYNNHPFPSSPSWFAMSCLLWVKCGE